MEFRSSPISGWQSPSPSFTMSEIPIILVTFSMYFDQQPHDQKPDGGANFGFPRFAGR
jgi:hypothetical protein